MKGFRVNKRVANFLLSSSLLLFTKLNTVVYYIVYVRVEAAAATTFLCLVIEFSFVLLIKRYTLAFENVFGSISSSWEFFMAMRNSMATAH